jgi:hypothetical protein
MNLSDMAAVVCLRLNKSDDDSLSACKTFLRQRNEMLYHTALWKETQVVDTCRASQAADADEWRPELILPATIARPLAIRKGVDGVDGFIRATSLATVMMTQSGAMGAIGAPVEYAEIAPCGLPWAQDYPWNQLTLEPTNAADRGVIVLVNGVNGDELPFREAVTLTAGSANTAAYWSQVSSIVKPRTAGWVKISVGYDTYSMPPEETKTEFSRVRLFQVPEWTVESTDSGSIPVQQKFLVLGKAPVSGFATDEDGPMLRGSDNCLIAFATADMLERGRQYGKAQAKLQEAGALLQQMLVVDQAQSAGIMRLIPEVTIEAGSIEDFP